MIHHAPIFHAIALGVPVATILQWIETYGFPILLKVLPGVLQSLPPGSTLATIIQIIEAALIAVKP